MTQFMNSSFTVPMGGEKCLPFCKCKQCKDKKRILVTGGAGFLGHHVCEHILKNTNWRIVVLDKLGYSSTGFDRLKDVNVYDDARVTVLTTDLCQEIPEGLAKEIGGINYVLHLAAESHVDNSIKNPEAFVRSNVLGTMHLLNYCREVETIEKIVYFSTDEVFGPAPKGTNYKEWDRYNSTNPYSASKAGGEEIALAYANTYNMPIIITHTMNIFGERQHPEKFIPMVIKKVLAGEKVFIHSDKTKTIPGSRFWIHARNVATVLMMLLDKGVAREKYNIVGEKEVDNLEMARFISTVIGKNLEYELIDFHSSRPGHDLRYALDGTKLKNMGFIYPKTFEESLKKTIEWTINNKHWL